MSLIKIGQAAKILGVCIKTLRNWENRGELIPKRKSQGGTRFYDEQDVKAFADSCFKKEPVKKTTPVELVAEIDEFDEFIT